MILERYQARAPPGGGLDWLSIPVQDVFCAQELRIPKLVDCTLLENHAAAMGITMTVGQSHSTGPGPLNNTGGCAVGVH